MLMFDIDPTALTVVIEAIIALLLAIIAYFNKVRTDTSAITANAAVQTSVTNTAMAAAAQPAATIVSTGEQKAGFIYPRDGSKLADGLDGWYARINPSSQAATLPDNQCYQAVSPRGNFHSGDRDTIMYLISSVEAAGWRARNA